jgi:hypothetical protein
MMRMWDSADCFRLAGLVNVPSLYNNQPKLKRDPIVASRTSFSPFSEVFNNAAESQAR